MSRANVDLLERALQASQDDPLAFLGILDQDVRWEADRLEVPDLSGDWRGPAAVVEFFRRWLAPFDEWGWEFSEVIDAGDTVVVRIRQWGRGKGSGVPIENAFWQAWTFRDAKVVRTAHYLTRAEALEALGLSE